MNAVAAPAYGEIVDDVAEFFAPMSGDAIDGLLGRYDSARRNIEALHDFVIAGGKAGALNYFLEGNGDNGRHGTISVERLFQLPGAIASLNSSYWGEALALTDVYDAMPQKRRNEWNEQIREHKAPDFEESTVRATLSELLAARAKFFAERVDGIFQALSGEHVTNSPSAFGKRMIVARMLTYYDTVDHDRAGYLNDLRCIIAKFMGREEPGHNSTGPLLEILRRNTGQWHSVDGHALKIRLYKKGTAHIEIHPDMAWRLNSVLASIYPSAIPASFRTKPARRTKVFQMVGRPLPFTVVNALAGMKPQPCRPVQVDRWSPPREPLTDNVNALQFGVDRHSAITQAEAEKVLAMIGGVKRTAGGHSWFEFDFNPRSALDEIISSGCIPDQKAHQFYPTPENVAAAAVEMAQIEPEHSCLEPSAGMGGLADLMPKAKTVCIEISDLHCEVLKAKGYYVECADFLKWQITGKYDRIVMNPPYSEGRWQAHIERAASMLKLGGRLVAVLPASAKGKDVLPGLKHEWSQIYNNEFAGTSVSVVILSASAA
ncbi:MULTISPECIES: class I SAM-dependent methyltransferase [Pseudomonas]|uniref:DNA restriction methylase n=1 Tax=Pseudomonas lundensis TaxID=86185 RepID=A0AAX2H7N9_9PSED|nr:MULTISPECIES: class I SAM-dependent methyltransferase [Pseudomonas]NNA42374.1 DUF4942 domain-containing protein [Pseudomonas lundensis]SOB52664.1 DNA restriction methylase [Pseudomonas lundensis]HCS09362.1 DUF4942 domain-containing protein [Pseudomonas sp.]